MSMYVTRIDLNIFVFISVSHIQRRIYILKGLKQEMDKY
jgi:hypothetical protein